MDNRWFTVEEVAERLSLHPETVRNWLRGGRLKGTRLSRRAGWRVREEDLDALLSGQERSVPNEEAPADSDQTPT